MTTERPLTVIALCAAWCRTCEEFQPAFERIAAERPASRFVWLDIEDDAEIVGDIDVENFPTIAVYDASGLLHFGVSLPHEGVVRRLVEAMGREPRQPLDEPRAAVTLPQRLTG